MANRTCRRNALGRAAFTAGLHECRLFDAEDLGDVGDGETAGVKFTGTVEINGSPLAVAPSNPGPLERSRDRVRAEAVLVGQLPNVPAGFVPGNQHYTLRRRRATASSGHRPGRFVRPSGQIQQPLEALHLVRVVRVKR